MMNKGGIQVANKVVKMLPKQRIKRDNKKQTIKI